MTMSYKTAQKINRDTGHSVEWAEANREYVIWPEGIPFSDAASTRRCIAKLDAESTRRLMADDEGGDLGSQ